MANFANPNVSDIVATTIQSRTRKIADNVTANNAILKKLSMRGKQKPFSGGYEIMEELSFAENTNTGWYSGYDILPVGVSDVISAAVYPIKQAAVPVVISGLEMLQNAGRERMIDLLDGRLSVAESSMKNLISNGIYSDGSAAGGKQIDGLDVAVPLTPTNVYGGIDRNTAIGAFWKNQVSNQTAANGLDPTKIQGFWNGLWAACTRGSDQVDLIVCDNTVWEAYVASLQNNQRFTSPEVGDSGFVTLKFMGADVVLDGGIQGSDAGTGCPAGTAFFLNCEYLRYRPHSARNMVPLSPNRRYATNQDAEVQILGWAGNLTTCGSQFQGRYDATG
jgi:hypothetical protein